MRCLVLLMLIIVVQGQSDVSFVKCKSDQSTCQGPFAENHTLVFGTQIFDYFCCDTGFRLIMISPLQCACLKEYDVTECIQDSCPTGVKKESGDSCICAHYLSPKPWFLTSGGN